MRHRLLPHKPPICTQALRILFALEDCARRHAPCPTNRALGAALGIPLQAAAGHIDVLRRRGLIVVRFDGLNRAVFCRRIWLTTGFSRPSQNDPECAAALAVEDEIFGRRRRA